MPSEVGEIGPTAGSHCSFVNRSSVSSKPEQPRAVPLAGPAGFRRGSVICESGVSIVIDGEQTTVGLGP
jgi:hypothetical protein